MYLVTQYVYILLKCYMIVNLWFVFIFFQGDVKVKRFTLNDKEKALKEQFLKRWQHVWTMFRRGHWTAHLTNLLLAPSPSLWLLPLCDVSVIQGSIHLGNAIPPFLLPSPVDYPSPALPPSPPSMDISHDQGRYDVDNFMFSVTFWIKHVFQLKVIALFIILGNKCLLQLHVFNHRYNNLSFHHNANLIFMWRFHRSYLAVGMSIRPIQTLTECVLITI